MSGGCSLSLIRRQVALPLKGRPKDIPSCLFHGVILSYKQNVIFKWKHHRILQTFFAFLDKPSQLWSNQDIENASPFMEQRKSQDQAVLKAWLLQYAVDLLPMQSPNITFKSILYTENCIHKPSPYFQPFQVDNVSLWGEMDLDPDSLLIGSPSTQPIHRDIQ